MKTLLIKFIGFFVIFQTSLTAQSNLNEYKYVSVSERFDFMKSSDQYQISSLTKFLLRKNGFTVLEDTQDYPSDLALNRCLLLDINVVKIKSFLKTKLEIQFVDCKDQIIFKTSYGTSKEKDFKKAYHQALRDAFESIKDLNYKYDNSYQKNIISKKKTSLINKNIQSVQNSEISVAKLEVPVKADSKELNKIKVNLTVYGYDIINQKGLVLYSLFETIQEGVFIIDKLTGIAYKRGNLWVREYVINKRIVIEPLINSF